jgi:hypothetical protein
MKPNAKALLQALADGLTGYMTFESRCGMSAAYTEYLLYAAIVRMVNHRAMKWQMESEWPYQQVAGLKSKGRGDQKRIDFFFNPKDSSEAKLKNSVLLEVKYAKNSSRLKVAGDIEKLKEALKLHNAISPVAFILIAGLHRFDTNGFAHLQNKVSGFDANQTAMISVGYKGNGTRHNYGVSIYQVHQ